MYTETTTSSVGHEIYRSSVASLREIPTQTGFIKLYTRRDVFGPDRGWLIFIIYAATRLRRPI